LTLAPDRPLTLHLTVMSLNAAGTPDTCC
jgi:hypothetical protein